MRRRCSEVRTPLAAEKRRFQRFFEKKNDQKTDYYEKSTLKNLNKRRENTF